MAKREAADVRPGDLRHPLRRQLVARRQKLAFGCADNTVRAIDATSGKQVLFKGAHADWVLGTVFSQDGEHLVSVSRDMSMKLTEVATQRFIDNVTSITPGALKGGLMALDRRPMKEKKMQKVPPDTPGVPPKVYDELIVGGSDGDAAAVQDAPRPEAGDRRRRQQGPRSTRRCPAASRR